MSPSPPLTGLVLLAACAAPPPARPLTPDRRDTLELVGRLRDGSAEPLSETSRRARPRPAPPPAELPVDMLSALGSTLTGGTFDPDRGQALVDELALQPADEVEHWGAGVMSLVDLFGPALDGVDGLCEDPHARFAFAEDSVDWEVDLRLFGLLQLLTPVQTLFMDLSEECAAAVDAAGGDVETALDAGSCTEQEIQAFFVEGGDCRACVEGGDPVQACLDADACVSTHPLVDKRGNTWLEWAETEVLACAPDLHARLQLGAWDLEDDGTLPESWDHGTWKAICFMFRSDDTGEVERTCAVDGDGTSVLGDGVGDGVISRIGWLRETGTDGLGHAERVGYNRALAFADGRSTSQFVLSFGGIGQISTPSIPTDGDGDGDVDDDDWGSAYGGWGFNPRQLRPDGTDPLDLDDTFARDWLASVALKMSTTRDDVPINIINHSHCVEWTGPHDDGSYTCLEVGGPGLGWFEDIHVFPASSEYTRVYPEALMTIGSTGLPDDALPGGFAPLIAGTEHLARPTWEDCTWPHTLVPDHMRTEDSYMDWGGRASLDAHTYKFGKDPDLDIRVVLATSQARGFCTDWQ